jgi:hypothetical protein
MKPDPGDDASADGAGLNRWTVGAAGTRTAAKWMIGSLAAAATLIFGAGPIVNRPELSWADNSGQLVIALCVGAFGLVCLILLIGRIATVLTPVKVSLETIPDDMLQDLNAAATVRLPSGSATYVEFLSRYHSYKVLVAKLSNQVASVEDADPHAEIRRAQLKTLLDDAQHNLDVYTRAADSYLNQADFYGVSNLFNRRRRWTALGLAVGAAVGALGFQLALTSTPKDAKKAPELAYLVVPTGPNVLWDALDLSACTVGKKVPVLVSGGNGSDEQPYSVTVLAANDRCVPKSFDLRADVLALEKLPAATVTVNYQQGSQP